MLSTRCKRLLSSTLTWSGPVSLTDSYWLPATESVQQLLLSGLLRFVSRQGKNTSCRTGVVRHTPCSKAVSQVRILHYKTYINPIYVCVHGILAHTDVPYLFDKFMNHQLLAYYVDGSACFNALPCNSFGVSERTWGIVYLFFYSLFNDASVVETV